MITVMTLPRHYLLVDDNPEDQFLAQEAFEQLCPECVLACVGSGRAALDLMHTLGFEPDVVLLGSEDRIRFGAVVRGVSL